VQVAMGHTQSTVCVCTRQSSWKPSSSTLEPDRPQHDRPAAYVIAQQYSSATFVSLCFHSRKGKIRDVSKMLLFLSFTFFLNCGERLYGTHQLVFLMVTYTRVLCEVRTESLYAMHIYLCSKAHTDTRSSHSFPSVRECSVRESNA
jgi:hypothetical protein